MPSQQSLEILRAAETICMANAKNLIVTCPWEADVYNWACVYEYLCPNTGLKFYIKVLLNSGLSGNSFLCPNHKPSLT